MQLLIKLMLIIEASSPIRLLLSSKNWPSSIQLLGKTQRLMIFLHLEWELTSMQPLIPVNSRSCKQISQHQLRFSQLSARKLLTMMTSEISLEMSLMPAPSTLISKKGSLKLQVRLWLPIKQKLTDWNSKLKLLRVNKTNLFNNFLRALMWMIRLSNSLKHTYSRSLLSFNRRACSQKTP